MSKKISIITCVYGAEKYINKCLDSLLAQTYANLEIILIDDGSPDNCPKICDAYAAKDSRIKLIHQKNQGYGIARNVGLAAATGDYIGFVDPDDWVDTHMLEMLMAASEKKGNVDIAICDWTTYEHNQEEIGQLHSQNLDNSWVMEKVRDEFLLDNYPNYLCNKLFARHLFADLVIPPDIVLGDLFVCAELFVRAKSFCYVPQGFYCYRIHASFANTRAKVRRKYGMFMAWREHERVCAQYKLSPLAYSQGRAVKAAISLLALDDASPYLSLEQRQDVLSYLKNKKLLAEVKLPLKHKMQLWAIYNAPGLLKKFGAISIYFDNIKQKRKFNKE